MTLERRGAPPRRCFERACALADVPKDEALAVTIGEYDVAVAA